MLIPIDVMGEKSFRCPRRPVLENPKVFSHYLSLHKDYEKGILPEPGSRAEQCAYVMDVLGLLDNIYARIRRFEQESRQRQGQSGGSARATVTSRG